eukprot:SAG31_NODE_7516_length_1666_cov_5.846203_1_plen_77_part_10
MAAGRSACCGGRRARRLVDLDLISGGVRLKAAAAPAPGGSVLSAVSSPLRGKPTPDPAQSRGGRVVAMSSAAETRVA